MSSAPPEDAALGAPAPKWWGIASILKYRGGLVRRPLVALVLAAAIPLLLLAGWAGYRAAERERTAARLAASEAVEDVAARVVAELSAQVQVAEALALSAALDAPDLAAFYSEAQRLVEARPYWYTIELDDLSGNQVLNLLRPLGAPLGPTADRESFDEVIRTREATVGGIGPIGPVSGKRLVTVRVPVKRNGELRHVLTVSLAPHAISDILRAAGAPDAWVGAVVDGSGDIVARTVGEYAAQGQPASPDARAAIARGFDGFYWGRTLEGVESDIVYRNLPGTLGWTVHFAIPSEFLNGPVRQSLYRLGAGAVVSLGLAGGLASLFARDLAQRRREQQALADAALQASEERRTIAVEAADLGTWRWNFDGGHVSGSERFRSLLNLPSGSGDGRELRWTTDQVLGALHIDDRAALHSAISSPGAERLIDLELRAMLAEGGTRWVRLTGRVPAANPDQIHGVIADIHERKSAELERLQLLRRLAEAQEGVQRRIARELHDQVGQTVTGLSLGLKSLETAVGDGDREQVRWLQKLANQVGRDIHRAAADLRPTALDDLGLYRALAADSSDWTRRHGIALDFQVVGGEARLPPEIETVAYRVVQEALTNVLKHAEANSVSVVLERRNGQLMLIIEDDGVGFDPEDVPPGGHRHDGPVDPDASRPRLGISGIRERLALVGGSLTVESSPGAGTTLFVTIPLPSEPGP